MGSLSLSTDMLITGTMTITAVGYDTQMTASSVRAGISRLTKLDDYVDSAGNSISVALMGGSTYQAYEDERDDTSEPYDDDYAPEYRGEALEAAHITKFAKLSFGALMDDYCADLEPQNTTLYILLGVASETRPGPRFEGENGELAGLLAGLAKERVANVKTEIVRSGNASTIRCLERAREILTKHPQAICVVGGVDSLLGEETLDWFEADERLKSETFGRNQGFSPAEAVAFTFVETSAGARARNKQPLAQLHGIGIAQEPAPLLSEEPSRATGLTQACRRALDESPCRPDDVRTVMGDMNGEYFSMKEWSYAESRCFHSAETSRELWHPADCFGSVGAASGVVLINISVIGLIDGWLKDCAMVICSDDGPECGAVFIRQNGEKNNHSKRGERNGK